MVRALSFSHIWISGAAALTAWASVILAGEPEVSATRCLWVGLSTGLGYTVQRAIKHALDPQNMPPLRRTFWNRHGRTLILSWSGGWALFTAANWNVLNLMGHGATLVALVLVGLLYAVVPGTRGGLRASPWLKIPVIASAWALATTVLVDSSDGWLFASRWLLVAGLTLPFDVRDLEVDAQRISTVPMAWGVPHTFAVAAALLMASSLCILAVPTWSDHPWLGGLVVAQGALAAGMVSWPRVRQALTSGSDREREWWTGIALDGLLWLPALSLVVEFL